MVEEIKEVKESKEYTGPDRRIQCPQECNLNEIWELLRSIEKKVDEQITSDKIYKPKLLELIELLDQSKGALRLLKLIAITVAPIVAAAVWIKDHVKI